MAALLPRLLTDAAAGNYQGLFALAFSRDLPKGAMSDGMFLSVVCAEDLPRITADDIARETRAAVHRHGHVRHPDAGRANSGRVDPLPTGYYEPVASDRPVLIFSGADDPVTPPSWGEQVASHLPHSRHFVVPGAGHITFMRGCVPELVATIPRDAPVSDGLDGACLTAL